MSSQRLHLRLKPSAEARVRSGHPWIFSESIVAQNRPGKTGELAVIFDRNNKFLAAGFYDADSPIRTRIVHRGKPAQIDELFWERKLKESLARREGLFNAGTNAGRWINGESDGFPALVLDRYAETLVLKLYSAIWLSKVEEIAGMIQKILAPERLVLRLSRNIQAQAAKDGFEEGTILFGPVCTGPVRFLESGITFEADVVKGQKTGFFLDQRENRRIIGQTSRGKKVLNAFSFSGGFSLYAASGGATAVTDCDISAHALESSRRNFALNQSPTISNCRHDLVQADVFEWLERGSEAAFDVVVLDPPSLARREAERERALKAYSRLACHGARITRRNGLLLCCSCSAHVGAEEFFKEVKAGMWKQGRPFSVLKTATEPADHHAEFPEAAYLKAIYIGFENRQTL